LEWLLQILGVALKQFPCASHDHNEDGYQLCRREDVHHTGGQVHTVAVDVHDDQDREHRDQLDDSVRRLALGDEGFHSVLGKAEADDGHLRGLQHQRGDPGEEERRQGAECVHEVGVLCATAGVHGA